MDRIVFDAETCTQLTESPATEVCDPTGQVVGYFFAGDSKPGQPPPGFEVPISIEETERRRQVRTGRTTEQILGSLGLE